MRALVLMLVLAACGSSSQNFPRALNAWRAGQRGVAVAEAREEVARWQDGNDIGDAELAEAVAAVDRYFDDDIPIVASGDSGAPLIGSETNLDAQLGADLISNRATRVIRAARSVEALLLERHAPAIITVIFRREKVEADGGLLSEARPALRSVATKRLALRALEALAAPKRPVL